MFRQCRSLLAVVALALPAVAHADEAPLRAGVGRADITPPHTGYYLGGWTRADRLAEGQQTRLFAQALVLERGDRKVALVDAELFAIPGGMAQDIVDGVKDLGYTEDTVLIGATHTHSGPGGYSPNPTLNTAAPNLQMILSDPSSLAELLHPKPADVQLYTFLVHQVIAAIRDADADLAPAAAAWGSEQLTGLTRNRSLEAHLADHGILRAPHTAAPADDPEGADHTIDPNVDVLRVDQLGPGGRRIPVGAWSEFADHGTVVKSELQAYSGDHHATAQRRFAEIVRREGDVPDGQPVVNVYGNSDEGDISAGLDHTGPAGAAEVGRIEADAMLAAWRDAGTRLSTTPELDTRFTRACFCGTRVGLGRVAKKGVPGAPFLTGSEEGRGPLYDVLHVDFEGLRLPLPLAPDGQGDKLEVPVGDFPAAVPVTVVRIADRMIATLPGEPTKEVGARVKAAVLAATRAAGVRKVVIAGLTNEYINYITTPQEYDRQHYEGGSTMFGRYESVFLQDQLTGLARALVAGRPAPPSYGPIDLHNGIAPNGPAYPAGATSGTITAQPDATVPRLGHAVLSWTGGPSGADRPVGAPFVSAEQRVGGIWRPVDTDLGLNMLWRVDDQGHYNATWEVPADAGPGVYRLVVTATGYRLESQTFVVEPSAALQVTPIDAGAGRAGVRLSWPAARENVDLTERPAIGAGRVDFLVDGQTVRGQPGPDATFTVAAPAGATIVVPAGAAQDAVGNHNAADVTVAGH